MLLEESGILLNPGEQIIKQGKCNGKIPVGQNLYVQNMAIWKNINGELVVTNQREFALAKQGMIRKTIEFYNLKIVGVNAKKSLFGKEYLELFLNIGDPKAQKTELEVDNPNEWMNKIKEKNTTSKS